jgi:hypothetical protein
MGTSEGADGYKGVTDATVAKSVLDMAKEPGALEGFIAALCARKPRPTRESILASYSGGNEEVRAALMKALESVPLPSEPEYPNVTPREPEKIESGKHLLTRENLHVFDAEYEYPGSTEEEKEEVDALIRNACSFAGFLKKPYVQINFQNGSRVYTYTVKKGVYKPEVVSDPDVVDDFKE